MSMESKELVRVGNNMPANALKITNDANCPCLCHLQGSEEYRYGCGMCTEYDGEPLFHNFNAAKSPSPGEKS